MAREMTPQERSAAPVEVRQALADKVKNLIVSNLTHEEDQLWLANVDAFEERAYQRGRRAALLEAVNIAKGYAEAAKVLDVEGPYSYRTSKRKTSECIAAAIERLAQEG